MDRCARPAKAVAPAKSSRSSQTLGRAGRRRASVQAIAGGSSPCRGNAEIRVSGSVAGGAGGVVSALWGGCSPGCSSKLRRTGGQSWGYFSSSYTSSKRDMLRLGQDVTVNAAEKVSRVYIDSTRLFGLCSIHPMPAHIARPFLSYFGPPYRPHRARGSPVHGRRIQWHCGLERRRPEMHSRRCRGAQSQQFVVIKVYFT